MRDHHATRLTRRASKAIKNDWINTAAALTGP